MALKNVTFGVSTWLWTSPFNRDTVSLFPKIKSYGYDAVEIPVEDPELIDLDWVKKALADNGLKPIICGAFGPTRDLTHEDPQFHQICFDYLDSCFQIASELGAGFVAGPMYSAVGKARLVSPEQKKSSGTVPSPTFRKSVKEPENLAWKSPSKRSIALKQT